MAGFKTGPLGLYSGRRRRSEGNRETFHVVHKRGRERRGCAVHVGGWDYCHKKEKEGRTLRRKELLMYDSLVWGYFVPGVPHCAILI